MNMDIKKIRKNFSPAELLTGEFGIEREGLRVHDDGSLALTPHPEIFGNKLKNPYFTTDFSESQVEIITAIYTECERAYEVLLGMVNVVESEIGPDEYFWPQSMPCNLPDDSLIPIARYEGCGAEKAMNYRRGLIERYGGERQMISGIHLNFSFAPAFIDKAHRLFGQGESRQEFSDALYLKLVRNYLRYRWLVIYLTGATSCLHKSYLPECTSQMEKIDEESYVLEDCTSFRNSGCGYKNAKPLYAGYDSVADYCRDIEGFVSEGLISEAKEHYAQIRLKAQDISDPLTSLQNDGIKYVEVRTIDLNPFDPAGVAKVDLDFIHRFMYYLIFKDETEYGLWQEEAGANEDAVATAGLRPGLQLFQDGVLRDMRDWAREILEEMEEVTVLLDLGGEEVIQTMLERVEDPTETYAHRLVELVRAEGYLAGQMRLAKSYKQAAYDKRYLYRGFESYELSTQILIKEAMTRGVPVTELDPRDNFIALGKGEQTTWVKQATKTQADNYASVLAMENKVVTKKILAAQGIPVPAGEEFNSLVQARGNISRYVDKAVVIKPKSTNFGLGISIFDHGGCEEDLLSACEIAFAHDDTVLVEEYLAGEEFRFLVIAGQVEAVLQRIPANVTGDGVHSILELAEIKNAHPFRGEGYTAPAKKIRFDDQTLLFLKGQGLTPETIPTEGERVFLRGNSNISTGGDSVDLTDAMPQVFKEVAVAAAQAIDAVFCGVDLIIADYHDETSGYGIIELNFNPSTDMHAYPLYGKELRTGEMILRALKLI